MTLLNLFHTGGLTLALSLVAFGLISWFMFQAGRTHKANTPKVPYWQIPMFWFAVAVLVLYIIAILSVASDYRGA